MKKLVVFFSMLIVSLAFIQKAGAYEPWGVAIYNETNEPADYAVPGATLGKKTGEATCKTVLGIVNWGDCSVKTAMKNGNISRVTAADWAKKFVIVYGEKTLRVYGN